MPLIYDLERVQSNGSVARMMALAAELGLAEADVAHMPHQVAAEVAEGCVWDEERWARYDQREYKPDRDWHAVFAAEADIATVTGLEGIVSYLLTHFSEESVERILRQPRRTVHLSPQEMARQQRLKLDTQVAHGTWMGGPSTSGL
ncbi:hypothetical protein [Nonomuraea sp. NPDC049646]|uniref:hypothetical protein n=1 Tax=unclassified Nonomuraea TaxID=2593643 RepID=UPI00378F53E9